MKNYYDTDPEFMERFEHFAFDEVVNEEGQQLDDITRHMAIIATLLGCQGIDEFRIELPRALDAGLTPVMVKEIVYQAVDYLGIQCHKRNPLILRGGTSAERPGNNH